MFQRKGPMIRNMVEVLWQAAAGQFDAHSELLVTPVCWCWRMTSKALPRSLRAAFAASP